MQTSSSLVELLMLQGDTHSIKLTHLYCFRESTFILDLGQCIGTLIFIKLLEEYAVMNFSKVHLLKPFLDDTIKIACLVL